MSDMFPRASRLRPGYQREQVDRYFTTAHEIYDAGEFEEMDSEGVRTVAFDIVRGGYDPDAVDAALDRLETAFLQRKRQNFVANEGREAWMSQVAQLATTLYPRLLRPAGERFAPVKDVTAVRRSTTSWSVSPPTSTQRPSSPPRRSGGLPS